MWRAADEAAHWEPRISTCPLAGQSYCRAAARSRGIRVEIEIIKTTGDRLQEVTFAQVGSKGMFTKEIEEALAEGRVDLAVHSLKDLPTELARAVCAGGYAKARGSARCVCLSEVCEPGGAAAGCAGGNQQPAAEGAANGAQAGY